MGQEVMSEGCDFRHQVWGCPDYKSEDERSHVFQSVVYRSETGDKERTSPYPWVG